MKILYNIKLIGLLLSLLVLSGCNKTISFDGILSVSFYNHPSDLEISIFSIENETIPITTISPNNKGSLELNLNIGNYIIQPHSSSNYYPSKGFQINQDKTTSLIYDENNNCKSN